MKKLLFLLALLFVFGKGNAQWTNTGNDGVPPINIFDLDSFQITLNSYSIYKSTNNGQSWSRLESAPAVVFFDLIVSNNRIITSTQNGIYISNDLGVTWLASSSGISNAGNVFDHALIRLPNSEIIYSNGSNGLFKSINNGNSWTAMPQSPTNIRNVIFDSISNLMVCATQTGIYISNDYGQSWNQQNSGLSSSNLSMLEFLNGLWFCASTNNNIYYSPNNTFQWSIVTGLTGTYMNPKILLANNLLLANRTTGVHVFNFNTQQFEYSNLNQSFPVCISEGINQIFFGGEIISNKPNHFNSVFTIDLGLNWNYVNGIFNSSVSGFSSSNYDNLFFNGAGAGCFSKALDSSFYIIGAPYVFGSVSANITNSLKYQNQKFYSATNSGIWISNDSALTWVQHTSGLPQTPPSNYLYSYDLEVFGDTIIVSTDQGPYISTNGGTSFSIASFPGTTSSKDLLYHNGKLYSAGSPKMLVSSDLGANWVQFGSQTAVFRVLAAAGPYIYSASDQSIYMTIDTLGITSNFTGNLDPFIGQGNDPGIAAYDSLLFVSNFFRVGVHKMNVNQPGVYTDISDNLPVYEETPGFYQYPYMNFGSALTIFDNKLWLGTGGLSCFTHPLSDFGYPPVVVTDDKKVEMKEKKEEGLRVYPNPSYNELNLQYSFEGEGIITLLITDLTGRVVQQQNLAVSSSVSSLNIKDLPEGMYLLELFDQKGNSKKTKFIKQ